MQTLREYCENSLGRKMAQEEIARLENRFHCYMSDDCDEQSSQFFNYFLEEIEKIRTCQYYMEAPQGRLVAVSVKKYADAKGRELVRVKKCWGPLDRCPYDTADCSNCPRVAQTLPHGSNKILLPTL